MKIKIFAIAALSITVGAVVINTVILRRLIDGVLEEVRELELSEENAKALGEAELVYSDFKCKEKYISLTVSHDDLMSIEDSFAELIGYLAVEDFKGAEVARNRLTDALEHLRRLSSFNIESII